MKTCCICGQGFISRSEDVLIYGCVSCQKGHTENRELTRHLEKIKSAYGKVTKTQEPTQAIRMTL